MQALLHPKPGACGLLWHACQDSQPEQQAKHGNCDHTARCHEHANPTSDAGPVLCSWGSHILVTYGVLMGAAYVSLGLTIVSFASAMGSNVIYCTGTAVAVTLAAILGARFFSLVFEDGFRRLLASPLQSLLRPGYWLHGGMIGAALAVACRHWHDPAALFLVLDAIGMALPAFEFFSRLGCHSYGCCFGRRANCGGSAWHLLLPAAVYRHPSHRVVALHPELSGVQLFPTQLVSALLFAAQFLACRTACLLLPAQLAVPAGLPLAANLVLHSAVRLYTEQYRADFRGAALGGLMSMTGLISVTLAVAGLGMAVAATAYGLWYPAASLAAAMSLGSCLQAILYQHVSGNDTDSVLLCVAGSMLAVMALATAAYGYHRREVGRWV